MVKNVSFTSKMVVLASPKQIKGLEMRLNREAMAEVPMFEIKEPISKCPSREYTNTQDAEIQIFDAFKKGEYKTYNFEFHLPSQRFPVNVSMVKEGANGADSVYLVTTHGEAELIEQLKARIQNVKDMGEICKRKLTETSGVRKQDKILEELGIFKASEVKLASMLETFITKSAKEVPVNVKNIFEAIREKRFNFGILSFMEKVLLLKG